jgi:hypothetical protein
MQYAPSSPARRRARREFRPGNNRADRPPGNSVGQPAARQSPPQDCVTAPHRGRRYVVRARRRDGGARCHPIGTDSTAVRAYTLQSLRLITVWPMFSAAMLSLITGIVLGLGSKYGLVRYWWVAIKLVLNLILATLVVTALRGEVANAANVGAQLAAGADVEWNFTNMIYPPIVSPTALTIAFLLAVSKPWGRIRRRRV